MSILEVNNVSIRYMTGDFKEIGLKEYVMRKLTNNYRVNEFWADKDITFSLGEGDMLGIIGTNGAGKTTLLKVISGIMEPTKGYVKRNGEVVALLELGSGFDGDLTVRENTYLRGAMLGYTREFMNDTYDHIIDFAELREFQDRPFKQLSSGMKSRLAFSIASLVQPDILILDEVMAVGDGSFRKKSEEKMQEILSGGAATILVSHTIGQVRQMCNKVLWLHKGEQIAFGDDVKGICDRYEAFLAGDQSKLSESAKKENAGVPPVKTSVRGGGTLRDNAPIIEAVQPAPKNRIAEFLDKETEYGGKYPIRYILQECPGAQWLVVVFSAFSPRNHPIQHSYNFIGYFDHFPVHRLYIQDSCGCRGTYYLCNHMDFTVEKTVSDLICEIQKQCRCDNQHTVSVGSSKGGSAAAYFALKHNFAHALSMVPQFRIGTYVAHVSDTRDDMFSFDSTTSDVETLDMLMVQAVRKNQGTKVHVLTSKNDEQYPEQIAPFRDFLEKENYESKFEFSFENGIAAHSEAARYNGNFSRTKLCECIFGLSYRTNETALEFRKNESETYQNLTLQYHYIDNTGADLVCSISPTPQVISLHNVFWGEFSVYDQHKEMYRYAYHPWTTNELQAVCTEREADWNILFATPTNYTLPLSHAFYIYDKTNVCIHRQAYSSQREFFVPRNGRQGCRVTLFWRYKDTIITKHENLSALSDQKASFEKDVVEKKRIKILNSDILKQNGVLCFSLNVESTEPLKYAYYVLKNRLVLFKSQYQDKKIIVFPLASAGEYSIQYFIRTPDGEIMVGQSENITVTENDFPVLRESTLQ